ncbi:MAG: tail fiber protein [Bacteroidota bacterium]
MEPLIAQIMLFGGNFAPRGWAFCDGQLLSINSHSALFSLLGTTYGGDGRTTFGLPDLRGRIPVGPRHGPGLSNYVLGERGGQETHTLTLAELASHNHLVTGGSATMHTSAAAASPSPDGNYLAPDAAAPPYGTTRGTGVMASDAISVDSITIGNNGGSRPHNNLQPFLALNYIIALVGIFPSRS